MGKKNREDKLIPLGIFTYDTFKAISDPFTPHSSV